MKWYIQKRFDSANKKTKYKYKALFSFSFLCESFVSCLLTHIRDRGVNDWAILGRQAFSKEPRLQ